LELFAPLATTAGWVTLLTLIFLELVLGIDNLVFIAITTDRLPPEKQHIGRRIGLVAALVMRVILLCFAAWLTHLTNTLFTLPFDLPGIDPAINTRDLILLVGGVYLVYKGIAELIEKISHRAIAEKHGVDEQGKPVSARRITLVQAIGTIMVMDMIFSLDSVITAVGLSGEIIIMIIAVMLAVGIMIVFADPIANFINANPEMKILALTFIVAVGVKLVVESFDIHLAIEGTGTAGVHGSEVNAIDLMLYFAMLFSLIITVLQMVYNNRVEKRLALNDDAAEAVEAVEAVEDGDDEGAAAAKDANGGSGPVD
jgi:predicted tellurium resistance membrane protein TerC